MGLSKNYGTHFRSPYMKDHSIVGWLFMFGNSQRKDEGELPVKGIWELSGAQVKGVRVAGSPCSFD